VGIGIVGWCWALMAWMAGMDGMAGMAGLGWLAVASSYF